MGAAKAARCSAVPTLGMLEESRGNAAKAQELYQKILSLQPNDPIASNNLAFSMLENGGNLDMALSLAQTARRALPDAPAIADALTWAYYRKGNYGLAIPLLEDALHKAPQNANFHYHLGLVFQQSGDKAKAKAQFEKVLELDPKYNKANRIRQALKEVG
jgi:Flp pilus assembly protein TadD